MFCLVFVLNTKFTHHSHHIISSYRLRFSYGFISICLYVQSILSRWRHQETNNIIPHQPLKLSHWNSHSQDMTLKHKFYEFDPLATGSYTTTHPNNFRTLLSSEESCKVIGRVASRGCLVSFGNELDCF